MWWCGGKKEGWCGLCSTLSVSERRGEVIELQLRWRVCVDRKRVGGRLQGKR